MHTLPPSPSPSPSPPPPPSPSPRFRSPPHSHPRKAYETKSHAAALTLGETIADAVRQTASVLKSSGK
eukprot:6189564-Pleurochrysis_carterae.AAC.1